METFKDYAELYRAESEIEKALSTYRSECSKIKNLIKVFGKLPIESIKNSAIKSWKLKVHKKFSNKTINDHLAILRAIFACAEADSLLKTSPMSRIDNLEQNPAEPNPFEREELINFKNTQTSCHSGKALALLAVLTGLRICELLALTWDCVDFELKELYVNKAKVLGKYKVPKTKKSKRTVELNRHAVTLLKNHLEVTGKRKTRVIRVLQRDNKSIEKQHVRHVFINTHTGKPFIDSKQYGKNFFTPFLAKAEVVHRGPSQLRHTFASQCLTAGIDIVWIAKEMGHSSTKMVVERYARWIKKDAPNHGASFSKCLDKVFTETESNPKKALDLSANTTVAGWSCYTRNQENSEFVRQCVQPSQSKSLTFSRSASGPK